MSSGRQLRDFIEVEDVASQLLVLAMHQDASGIYNSGSGIPRSVFEMAEEVVLSHKGKIDLRRGVYPDRDDEAVAFWAHMDKFHALQVIPQTHR